MFVTAICMQNTSFTTAVLIKVVQTVRY